MYYIYIYRGHHSHIVKPPERYYSNIEWHFKLCCQASAYEQSINEHGWCQQWKTWCTGIHEEDVYFQIKRPSSFQPVTIISKLLREKCYCIKVTWSFKEITRSQLISRSPNIYIYMLYSEINYTLYSEINYTLLSERFLPIFHNLVRIANECTAYLYT